MATSYFMALGFALGALSAHGAAVERTLRHPKSLCTIWSSQDDHPQYKVMRDGRAIFSPEADGVGDVQFSPSGRYVIFNNSDKNGLDLEPGKFDYGLVILNCATGEAKGYEKVGCSASSKPGTCSYTHVEVKNWTKNEKSVVYVLHDGKKKRAKTLSFTRKHPLP